MTNREAVQNNVQKLKELASSSKVNELLDVTKKILNFHDILESDTQSAKLLKVDKGNSIVLGVFKDEDVAIVRIFMSKDSTIPLHTNDEKVVFGVIKGSIRFTIEDETIDLNQYDSYSINNGVKHGYQALEDSWLWKVTMPADNALPYKA